MAAGFTAGTKARGPIARTPQTVYNMKIRTKSVSRPKTPYRLILVEWDDSAGPISAWQWTDEYQIPETVLCTSVGYVTSSTKCALAIAHNLGDVGRERIQASGIIRIPRSSVRRMIDL